MAKLEKRTHETTREKLEWLEELRDQSEHHGSEKAVAKHREAGKLLARERAEKLCDPDSFVELDRYVRHRESNFGMLERRPYGDAVVTGYGTIFGRRVFVFKPGLHGLRRLAERGLRREDLQGDGPGGEIRMPRDRIKRLGRCPDPGGVSSRSPATRRSSGATCRAPA